MGCFVLVDGMDGSGKGVIIDGLREWAEAKNYNILDLKDYCRENACLPEASDIQKYDVIFSSEPSYDHIGRAISDEMIVDNKREYSVISTAWAFSLDREILYNKVIIPALKANKFVIQERGVITSLIYQPVQGRITLRELMDMPGNRLALKHSPNLLIITKVDPKTVIARLQIDGRIGNAIFSTLNFQRTIEERYSSPWLKGLFEKFGTNISYIDTNEPKTTEETKSEAKTILETYLAN
jgi:thymidylate kinase